MPNAPGAHAVPGSRPSQVLVWVAAVAFGALVAYGVVVLFARYGPADAEPRVRSFVLSDRAVR